MYECSNFYNASASASAALTGLIFIGISINLEKILQHSSLPTRASFSLLLLISILIFSLILLIPKQTPKLIGFLFTFLGFILWAIITKADLKIHIETNPEYKRLFLMNLFFDQLAVLPYIIGGIYILFLGQTGLYFIAFAFIVSFIKSVSDAWVLLIEILR
ncbi:hypothetical protein IRZ71_20570 [Flavobacterium sp. ANB]|uniref:hypothetical protein n=1 Tax=unclassified Flavobacterium TaxID=196869 RepID=UPI0012B804A6|nr:MULTISPECIES: hypothetical protein [unclassified Flavobacterium]MBF4518756.1 hypothetical protein [Flavobacterium sp. ANB]MTD71531.1 hypothetical protein [Flavobacterium sp. LC2016-13]